MLQDQGETIDIFVTRLRSQANKCDYVVESTTTAVTIGSDTHQVAIEYKDLTDNLIRDRIVVVVGDQSTRARLLREKNLNLEMAVMLA